MSGGTYFILFTENNGKAQNGKSKDSDVQQRETVIGCKQSLERDSPSASGS